MKKILKNIFKKILNFFNITILPVDNRKAYLVSSTKTVRSYQTFFKRVLNENYTITNDEIGRHKRFKILSIH